MKTEFDNVILQIADGLKRALTFIPQEIKRNCEEIRLRAGLPVCLTVKGRVVFVSKNSEVFDTLPKNPLITTSDDVQKTLSLLCRQSVYLHESELKQGFVSLSGGGRAGVCGIFNADGMLVSVSSINIRIARQIFGCASALLPYISGGLLIAGPPGCGKTTILRDLIRLVSNGEDGHYYRVAVIDSRRELSASGILDLGMNTDVICTANKASGTEIALRTMYPNFIAFDEIGTTTELEGVKNCFNAGVYVITTAHCCDNGEIMQRDITREIIKSGVVKNVALLSQRVGAAPQIFNVEELVKIGCA